MYLDNAWLKVDLRPARVLETLVYLPLGRLGLLIVAPATAPSLVVSTSRVTALATLADLGLPRLSFQLG